MAKLIFKCDCGRRTTEPFLINGQKFCTVCAEDLAPKIVASRTRANWASFTSLDRSVPMRPGFMNRYQTDKDG